MTIYTYSYDPPLAYKYLPRHLKHDPVHKWRAKKGIELIHKEPTYDEFKRICANWELMTDDQKRKSDKMSKKLYGMTNIEHMKALEQEYKK